jgi:hypothetical protein
MNTKHLKQLLVICIGLSLNACDSSSTQPRQTTNQPGVAPESSTSAEQVPLDFFLSSTVTDLKSKSLTLKVTADISKLLSSDAHNVLINNVLQNGEIVSFGDSTELSPECGLQTKHADQALPIGTQITFTQISDGDSWAVGSSQNDVSGVTKAILISDDSEITLSCEKFFSHIVDNYSVKAIRVKDISATIGPYLSVVPNQLDQ